MTHLYTEVSSVHVIAQEEVSGGGRWTTHLEEFYEIEELSMDIPAHGDGSLHVDHVLLLAQQGGAFGDDPHGHRLLDPSLQEEVLT